jgi:hypothetical protein
LLILCVVLGTPHPPKQVGRTALWWAAESGNAETLTVVLGLVLSKLAGDARDACLVAVGGDYNEDYKNFLQYAALKGALDDPKLVAQIEALPPITLATLLSAQDTASRRDPAAPAMRSPASCWWCCGGWWWWHGVIAYLGSPACRVGLLPVRRMLRPPAPTVQPRSQPNMLLLPNSQLFARTRCGSRGLATARHSRGVLGACLEPHGAAHYENACWAGRGHMLCRP